MVIGLNNLAHEKPQAIEISIDPRLGVYDVVPTIHASGMPPASVGSSRGAMAPAMLGGKHGACRMSFTVPWIDRNRSVQKRECASAIEALTLSYGRPAVVVKDSVGAHISERELRGLAEEKAVNAPRP